MFLKRTPSANVVFLGGCLRACPKIIKEEEPEAAKKIEPSAGPRRAPRKHLIYILLHLVCCRPTSDFGHRLPVWRSISKQSKQREHSNEMLAQAREISHLSSMENLINSSRESPFD